MNATLQDARALFPNVPAADTSAMSADELRDAIRTKGGAKFDAAFKEGATVLRKQLRRAQVLAFFSRLPPCLVGLEACATAHCGWQATSETSRWPNISCRK